MSNNSGSNEPNWFQKWSNETPLVTRSTILLILGSTLLTFITGTASLFANVPMAVLFKFQIHRLIFSPFIQSGILSVIFCLLSFGMRGKVWEQQQGSVKMLYLILVTSWLINLMVVFFALTLMPITSLFMMQPNVGFWGLIMALITLECLVEPDQERKLWLIGTPLKSKYFPWAIFAFFTLLGGFNLSILMGIIIGHLYTNGMLNKIMPSDARFGNWEMSSRMTWMRTSKGFIPVSSALGGGALLPVTSAGRSNSSGFGAMAPHGPTPQPFTGTGHTLGSGAAPKVIQQQPATATATIATPQENKSEDNDTKRNILAHAAEARMAATNPAEDVPVKNGTVIGEFKPEWDEDLSTLIAMGFNEDQSKNALIKVEGDLANACDYLTGAGGYN